MNNNSSRPSQSPDLLQQETQLLSHVIEQLREEKNSLERDNQHLQKEKERLIRELERVKQALEEARRGNKRQAAPFSKVAPKRQPAKPGRKSGLKYDIAIAPAFGKFMKPSRPLYPNSAPFVGDTASRIGSRNNIRRKLSVKLKSPDFMSVWAIARIVAKEFKAAIRCRPPTPHRQCRLSAWAASHQPGGLSQQTPGGLPGENRGLVSRHLRPARLPLVAGSARR